MINNVIFGYMGNRGKIHFLCFKVIGEMGKDCVSEMIVSQSVQPVALE